MIQSVDGKIYAKFNIAREKSNKSSIAVNLIKINLSNSIRIINQCIIIHVVGPSYQG